MDLKHSETSEMGKKLTLKGQSATFFSGVFFCSLLAEKRMLLVRLQLEKNKTAALKAKT